MPGSHKRAPCSFQVMAGHDNIGDDDDVDEEKIRRRIRRRRVLMMMMIYNCDDSDGDGVDGNTYHLYFMHLIEINRKGHHFNMFSALNINRSKPQYRNITGHPRKKCVSSKSAPNH